MPVSNEPALKWNGNEVDLYELAEPVIDCSWVVVIVCSIIITTLNAAFLVGTRYYVGLVGVPIVDLLLVLVLLWVFMNFFDFISNVQPGAAMTTAALLGLLFVLLAHTTGNVTDYYLTLMVREDYGLYITDPPGTMTILTQYGDWITGFLSLGVSSLIGIMLYWYSPRDLIRVIRG